MITIENVKKTFHDLFRPVLNGVDLALSQGDFCVVIGANGSGKSTLLKLISGEYKADSGEIAIQGSVSQVVQDVNLGTVPEMTLLENIALSEIKKPKFLFYRRYIEEVTQKLKELNLGLEEYIDRPLKILSGGQRQMIATLMAINSGSKILLLDEHTSALDPKMQELLMIYTAKQATERGLTVVMITHKMEDAIKYGNRLIMLNEGKIALDIQGIKKQELKMHDLLIVFHGDREKI